MSQHGPRTLLALSDTACVEICGCGTIHLTIGGTTLRLAQRELDQVARVASDAARKLPTSDLADRRWLASRVPS